MISTNEVLLYHGSCLVNRKRASIELRSVESRDGLTCRFVFHHDESETFGAPGVAVRDNTDRFDGPAFLKRPGHIALCRLKRQISYI